MQGSISVSIYLSYTVTFAQSIREADDAGNADKRLSLYKECREDRFLITRLLLNEFRLRLGDPQLFDKEYNFLYHGAISEQEIDHISKRYRDLYNTPEFSHLCYRDFLQKIITQKIKDIIEETAKTVTPFDVSVSFAEKGETASVI